MTEPTATSNSLADLGDIQRRALERSTLSSSPGFYTRAYRKFRRNTVSVVAFYAAILIIAFVVAAPLVSMATGFTLSENHLADKLKPAFTDGYVLGSDGNGRDILTRLAYGGRVSLVVAVLASLSTMFIGGVVGSVSGYFGGAVDSILMRFVDVLLSIPGLSLLILISALYRPGYIMLAFIIAAVGWAGVARIIRGEVLALRRRDFVEASRVIGASNFRIINRHIMPNVVPIMVIWASLAIPGLILVEASLSFLGLGVRPPTPSWGNMLQEARQFYRVAWTFVFFPGLFIYLTVLSINLVGNGLRDALDPRIDQ